MLKRKIYKMLIEWKNKYNGSTALLIDGARRIGKSYICEAFGKNEYKSYLIIDFGNISKEITDIFENESTNLDLFFMKISVFYGVRLYKRESLIIFDEVQQFPKARQLIKYLVKDGRYDYIETGSLLSLKRNMENIILPSEEKHIEMYPLDFEEFLWSLGDNVTIPLLKEFFWEKNFSWSGTSQKNYEWFQAIYFGWRNAQAVNKYLETKNFADVDEIKRDILNLYRNDIAKFAKGYENKVISIFNEIPSQLSKKEI